MFTWKMRRERQFHSQFTHHVEQCKLVYTLIHLGLVLKLEI